MSYKKLTALVFMVFIMGIITACESHKEQARVPEASEVKDRDSLQQFVLEAKFHLEKDYEKAVEDFKTEEKWKKGSIYLFGLTKDGVGLFNVVRPDLVGQNLIDITDKNGVEIVKKLLEAGGEEEGDFVEYLWDNPEVEGEDESPKVSYAIFFTGKDGVSHIVGSGFYPEEK